MMSQKQRREGPCEDSHPTLGLQSHPKYPAPLTHSQHLSTQGQLPSAVAAGRHSFPGPDALIPVLLGPGSAQPDCPIQLGAPEETGCNQALERHNSAHGLTDSPTQRPKKL